MKQLLGAILGLALITGCGQKTSTKPIAAPEGNSGDAAKDDWLNETGTLDDGLSDDTNFSVANTCTFEDRKDKDKCLELRVEIKAADATSGDRISRSVDGRANEPIAIAFTVEAKSSRFEDALRDSERVQLGFRGLPRDADTQVDGAKGALLWEPEKITSGKFTAVFRDVGRCIVEKAYNSKGKLDEDKAEDCEDFEKTGFDSYEETKEISYKIERSRIDQQKDAALSQVDAQCKANMMTSMIGGIPALFSGNPTGLLGVGANAFAGQVQCDAQKQQIEAQFEAQKFD